MEFGSKYQPAEVEGRVYDLWEKAGAFTADPSSNKQPYVIVIPPPNVTGSLHMGHALNNTLQDILTRMKRMQGFEALYLPGTDHAGIATQNVVEKDLAKEKRTRFDLGREQFIRRVWQWKEKFGNTILYQLRRLGCSCDWSRTRFTMDDRYSRAVKEVFITLHRKGLIYRGLYTINWCPRCLTALSDIEVARSEEKGRLWHLKYPLKGGGGSVVVATTRPETMLGDTAVAVHPRDERQNGILGRSVILPLTGREIPIIADEMVDPKFGTGAVKITPAHDANDFEAARRHNLPMIKMMDENGVVNENGGRFKGMDRFAARKAVLEALQNEGALEKEEEYTVALGKCHRCQTIIEPYLSEQWFVRMGPLAKPAAEIVEQGRIAFTPERWTKVYLEWVNNARDWCISRQIWWGHQIPIWYCPAKHTTAAAERPTQCAECGSTSLTQDPDVLDTWFSSALWPFATMGWPEETADLGKFYPTQTLVTGRDIIYLWVARMVFMGLEFRKNIPFSQVVINPTIQNPEGKRMSKSLGTGVDPLELIDAYGADAVRFGLTVQVSQSQDIRYAPAKIEQSRNFATKLWNACRFVLQQAGNAPAVVPPESDRRYEDRWILCRMESTIREYTQLLETWQFGPALQSVYRFVWNEFCDWYIELSKQRQDAAAKQILAYCVDRILRLLHPVMPFVTEEIWQRMRDAGRGAEPLLIKAGWPKADERLIDPRFVEETGMVFEIVRDVREIRNQMNIGRNVPLRATIDCRDKSAVDIVEKGRAVIAFLGGIDNLTSGVGLARPSASASAVAGALTLYIHLEGKIDVESEIKKQRALREKTLARMGAIEKKLGDPNFVGKAPPEIVEDERDRLEEIRDQARNMDEIIRSLEKN